MKILLVSAVDFLVHTGAGLIASILKNAGHTVRSVYCIKSEIYFDKKDDFARLREILNDTDMVMVSAYSPYLLRLIRASEYVRANYPDMKIIWGGPHCVSAPELSLKYADGVCFAEGDHVVVDLVNQLENGIETPNTPNMAFNVNGEIVKNDILPPTPDLDKLPFPDYDMNNDYVLDEDLRPMTMEILRGYTPPWPLPYKTFFTITSRGCPHLCSYCNNIRYFKLHGKNSLRFRSINHVIEELEYITKKYNFYEVMGLVDDDFLARPEKDLEEFAQKYKAKINLPFAINISANTFRKKKMELLLEVGLKLVNMGVQSGSQRVLDETLKRRVSVAKTKKVLNQMEPYRKKNNLKIMLDFIIDNPYETKKDIMQTYEYIYNLSPDIRVNTYLLSLYPGAPMYEKAIDDGIIQPFDEKAFRSYLPFQKNRVRTRYQNNFETFLVMSTQFGWVRRMPKSFFRIIGAPWFRGIASLIPTSFYHLVFLNLIFLINLAIWKIEKK